MTKCGCETGTNCTTTTVCQCELVADKLAEALDALVRFRVRPWFLVLGNCGNGTNSLAIDDAQAALKEYRGNAA